MSLLVSLNGGLGNLLFQLAAARTARYVTPNVALIEMTPGLFGRLQQYIGEIEIPLASKLQHQIFASSGSEWDCPKHHFTKALRYVFRPLMLEPIPAFTGIPQSFRRMTHVLDGYFQHPDWYRGQVARICAELVQNRPALLPQELSGVVAVHLRRSDYVRQGWDLKPAFYRAVVDRINSLQGVERVMILSDDAMVEELFALQVQASGLTVVDKGVFGPSSARRDFYLLAASQTLFLSNSTFSWWAAQLRFHSDPGNDRLIYCPNPWMPDGSGQLLQNPSWIGINAVYEVDS